MVMQLPLSLGLRDDATFANYYSTSNSNLLSCLAQFVSGQGEQFIYLWGQSGVGRSHLLQACCHANTDSQQTVMYLPLKETPDLDASVLQDIENIDLICIDDIDVKFGDQAWEEALLHFYNRARDQGTRLIVSSDQAPAFTRCVLADLRSRLSWGLTFEVCGLDDTQSLLALQMRAKNRGLELSDEVGHYLLTHYPRNMADLFSVLEKLDQASMIAKRRLTIPFVKEALAEFVV